MSKTINFKGQILFSHSMASNKKKPLKYNSPTFEKGFEESLTDTMMSSFDYLDLTAPEKKLLSRSHRKMLNYYRYLNPFALNLDAKNLVIEINNFNDDHVVVEANHYGAYVCLAALYSGKISSHKKVDFILEQAPLALFPKAFIKENTINKKHTVLFRISEDSWIKPFSSLYQNQNLKFTLSKIPFKRVA